MYKHINFVLLSLGCLFATSGCVNMQVDFPAAERVSAESLNTEPSLKDYRNFYLLGFFPQADVSVGKACLDQQPARLKSYASVEDIFFTVFSFGIYSPRTIAIWCVDEA